MTDTTREGTGLIPTTHETWITRPACVAAEGYTLRVGKSGSERRGSVGVVGRDGAFAVVLVGVHRGARYAWRERCAERIRASDLGHV